MRPTRPIGRRFGRPLAIPCCRQTVKRFETSREQRFCRHSLCMDSPPSGGYLSTLGWMEPDPRAGRQPDRSVKERTVKRHDFKDGEVIFRTSDPSDAAYLITHGRVEIVQERRDGETESVAVLRRGEYFGEMGAIDEKPRSASAIAKGPVACMSVSQEEFIGYAAEPASGVHRSPESPFRAPSQGE